MWYWLWWLPPGLPVALLLGWAVTGGRKRTGFQAYNIDAQRDPIISQVAYSPNESALPMRDRSFEKPRYRTYY